MKRLAVAAIAAGLLTACGAGGAGSPARPIAAPVANARLVVKIPAKTQSGSSMRRPAYVSSDTKSVSFEVSSDGGTSYGDRQTVDIDLTNAQECSPVGGGYQCSAQFTAPVGTVWLRIKAWSAAGGTGSVLSQGIVSNVTISQTQENDVNVSLNGVASSLSLVLSPSSVAAGTASSFYAVVEARDAAGDSIVAPPGSVVDANGDPIAPTLAAGSFASLFAIGAYDASTDRFAVDYNGDPSAEGSITFTAMASGYASAAANLSVTPLPGLSVNPTSIQFLDLTAQSVAIAESSYGSGTFTVTPSAGCAGVIDVPGTVAASGGDASLTVTPIAVGGMSPACTITIADAFGQSQVITVSVTRTHGTVQ